MVQSGLPLSGKRVFISYPRGGRTHALAEQIEQGLGQAGADVFRDETGIAPGDPDAIQRLEQALGRADVLAYLHGADTLDCDWQRKEALYALRDGTPVVVAQTHASPLLLEVLTAQPVAATGELMEWLPDLVKALRQAQRAHPRPTAQAGASPSAQAERDYLLHGLSSEWSDRVARYVPLAGEHRRTRQAQARRKHLLHDTRLLLTLAKEMGLEPEAKAEAQPFTDVLALYQHLLTLQQRPRLAVLGEPGAGKSFSLQRLFCALGEAALINELAPVPLLLALGDWTRPGMRMDDFMDGQLRRWGLDAHWRHLRDAGRAVLLLDGLNEIPVGQRITKAAEVFEAVQDQRWAGVLLSCRERDFSQCPLDLPMDQVRLAPLDEAQILDFLQRWAALDVEGPAAQQAAEQRFWALAAGPQRAAEARELWQTWQADSTTWQQFWNCQDLQQELPMVHFGTSEQQVQLWRQMRFNGRSLLRLARSPFWLEILALLPEVPEAGARVFEFFLQASHAQGQARCEQRQALAEVPVWDVWLQALRQLALDLQRWQAGEGSANTPPDDGAQTRLHRSECPYLNDTLLEFSIAVQVLKESGGQVGFAHQLMQETLAAHALLAMALDDPAWPLRLAPEWFFPPNGWWLPNGWEVVGELAGASLADKPADALRLVAWLGRAQPEVACRAWQAAGCPALPTAVAQALQRQWAPRLTTEAQAIPEARLVARAAIGRALGHFGLDQRPGVGLRPDGLPDIDWVEFADEQDFIYQGQTHPALPPFALARHPVTYAQFQAFVDDGGYAADAPWWQGLSQSFDTPTEAAWREPNAPRECVSWFEAVAFCRWLSHRLGQSIRLPTEQEWERSAAGTQGLAYPWGGEWDSTRANADGRLGRTCAVGLLPEGASLVGQVYDLAGNVWEWCLNDYRYPERIGTGGGGRRVLRGGSWDGTNSHPKVVLRLLQGVGPEPLDIAAEEAKASYRSFKYSVRRYDLGFRLCRASPI